MNSSSSSPGTPSQQSWIVNNIRSLISHQEEDSANLSDDDRTLTSPPKETNNTFVLPKVTVSVTNNSNNNNNVPLSNHLLKERQQTQLRFSEQVFMKQHLQIVNNKSKPELNIEFDQFLNRIDEEEEETEKKRALFGLHDKEEDELMMLFTKKKQKVSNSSTSLEQQNRPHKELSSHQRIEKSPFHQTLKQQNISKEEEEEEEEELNEPALSSSMIEMPIPKIYLINEEGGNNETNSNKSGNSFLDSNSSSFLNSKNNNSSSNYSPINKSCNISGNSRMLSYSNSSYSSSASCSTYFLTKQHQNSLIEGEEEDAADDTKHSSSTPFHIKAMNKLAEIESNKWEGIEDPTLASVSSALSWESPSDDEEYEKYNNRGGNKHRNNDHFSIQFNNNTNCNNNGRSLTNYFNNNNNNNLQQSNYYYNRQQQRFNYSAVAAETITNPNEPFQQQKRNNNSFTFDNRQGYAALQHQHHCRETMDHENTDPYRTKNRNNFNYNNYHYQNNENRSQLVNNSENLRFSNSSSSPSVSSSSVSSSSATASTTNKEQIVLHVKNLDYKISSVEWKRILMESFRKHCKEIHSVNVITNVDKSLLGIVKLGTKEDARLAISCLHHKKIGYKRLHVSIASCSSNSNSPKSKVIALLKQTETNEMALTRFIETYESRYSQTIAVSELFKLHDIIHISQSKVGHGRQIKLIAAAKNNCSNQNYNLETEMQDLLHTPYCSLHSSHYRKNNRDTSSFNHYPQWLPNVVVSLRTFKSAVHKLLNDHGGQMPLLSFMDCYRSCISNNETTNVSSSSLTEEKTERISSPMFIVVDNEQGLPLEHLITCAQDVQIQYNTETYCKQLQWENDKQRSSRKQQQQQQQQSSKGSEENEEQNDSDVDDDEENDEENDDDNNSGADDSDDEENEFQSHSSKHNSLAAVRHRRQLNQFTHEVIELFKQNSSICCIPLSKFNTEYQRKFGRQCRVADYGYTKLFELLQAVPHCVQIIDGELDKRLTLTHRVQVRRFSNDLIKVLRHHHNDNNNKTPSLSMFADEYPLAYEQHFQRSFDIRHYGVCFLEDMLAELSESTVTRSEIDGRTFLQIPQRGLVPSHSYQHQNEQRLQCAKRLANEIREMLSVRPRFSIQLAKFIPNYHHHFGRQCKLNHYGCGKLVDLLELDSVRRVVMVHDQNHHYQNQDHDNNNLEQCDMMPSFVQLCPRLMLETIAANFLRLVDETGNGQLNCANLLELEQLYTCKFERLCLEDFGCQRFVQLFIKLPWQKMFIRVLWGEKSLELIKHQQPNDLFKLPVHLQADYLNERELKRTAKLVLSRLMNEKWDERLITLLRSNNIGGEKTLSKRFRFFDLFKLFILFEKKKNQQQQQTLNANNDLSCLLMNLNERSVAYLQQCLVNYFNVEESEEEINDETKAVNIVGLSDLYLFAKQVKNLYKLTNQLDMSLPELEVSYKQIFGTVGNNSNTMVMMMSQSNSFNETPCQIVNEMPYKKLGFVDANLLFSQGLCLIVTIKKFSEKRICLNREFWPKTFLDVTMNKMETMVNSSGLTPIIGGLSTAEFLPKQSSFSNLLSTTDTDLIHQLKRVNSSQQMK